MGTDDGKGQAGTAVAANLAQLRKRRGMTVRQLSERLTELGAPILPSGITKIELGQRRVDVDDFLALAAALDVSPARLLLPDVGYEDEVAVTPALRRPSWAVWGWFEGQYSFPSEDLVPNNDDTYLDFVDLRPNWKRKVEAHPVHIAVRRLARSVEGVLRVRDWQPERQTPNTLARWVQTARHDLGRVENELQQIEREAEGDGPR